MRRYDYVFFDFDGTISDTGPGITRCVQYSLEKFGIIENDMSMLRRFVGPPLEESYMKFYGFSPEKADVAVEYYRNEYVEKGLYESCMYEGFDTLLESLDAVGVICGVASNKPEEMVLRMLGVFGLDGDFAAASGLRPGVETKALAIRDLQKKLGCPPQARTLMVGDRYSDAEGARECGLDFAAALYGYGPKAEFEPYPVKYWVQSPLELVKIVLE